MYKEYYHKKHYATTATNIRYWVGTRDDYVGGTDQPTKVRGTLEMVFSASYINYQRVTLG